jgi:hypothetical protein
LIAAARRSAFRRVAADFHIGMTMVLKMAPAEHMLLAQKARNSFKIAEAFRVPSGTVAPALWPDSPESEFVIWGTLGGKQVFVQRPGKLILKKEQL